MKIGKLRHLAHLVIMTALVTITPKTTHAHCDTLSGPVVTAAKKALDTGNINLVLIWVQPTDEADIRAAFAKARSTRQAGSPAKEKADMSFFETLVRIHRIGEGAPYTGIKPEGGDLGVAVPAADRALESGSGTELQKILGDAVQAGVKRHLHEVMELRRYDVNDVSLGRAFVKAYVEYTHYVEGVYEAATAAGHHEPGAAKAHGEQHDGNHKAHPDPKNHGGHDNHLPWILVGLLGVALILETSWLMARKKKS